jgi:hypothetical protein
MLVAKKFKEDREKQQAEKHDAPTGKSKAETMGKFNSGKHRGPLLYFYLHGSGSAVFGYRRPGP